MLPFIGVQMVYDTQCVSLINDWSTSHIVSCILLLSGVPSHCSGAVFLIPFRLKDHGQFDSLDSFGSLDLPTCMSWPEIERSNFESSESELQTLGFGI